MWGLPRLRLSVERTEGTYITKPEKVVAVSGVCSGVPEKKSGKVPAPLLEKFPELRNATNSKISVTGKGKPAKNLGSTLPGFCGVFLENDSASLLEFF